MFSNSTLKPFRLLAGLSGAVAMGMAAWASHGLAGDAAAAELVHKASYYQLVHALALLMVDRFGVTWAARCFAVGLLLFPTTLYLLAFGLPIGSVYLTPVGGTALILGWVAVALSAVLSKE